MNNQRDWIHDRYSLPGKFSHIDEDEELSEVSVHPFSYPISPRTRERIEEPLFPLPSGMLKLPDEFPDNVY